MSERQTAPRTPIGRRHFIELCAGSLIFVAVGCRRDESARTARSTLTVLYGVDERAVGPYWQMPSQFLVFLRLAAKNPQGELEGMLAESWEHSSDYRTWTIRLRPGIRWHDGRPVTAHDIKFTMDLFGHPKVLQDTPGAASVTVVDDRTFRITYHKQTSTGPLDTYAVYYPKHLLERLDPAKFYEWDFWVRPVGNGPYRYVRHVPQTMAEFEANPDYFRGKPKIERVVLKFRHQFGEAPSIAELLSGNVDAIPYVDRIDLPKLAADPRFAVYYHLQPGNLHAILWNQKHPLFADVRTRRALTLAIDRPSLRRALNIPDEIPIVDALFTERQFDRRELPAALPHDPRRAAELLDAVGWRDTDGDGVRDRGGRPFRFTTFVTPLQAVDRAAVYIQAQLRAVGVAMEIQRLELQAQRAAVTGGRFEAAIFSMYPNGPYGYQALFGAGSPLGYASKEAADLLEQAETTMDPDEVDGIYARLATVFRADLPATFLYPAVWTHVVHRRVRGLSSPYRAEPVWHAEHLWLEDRSDR